MGPVSRTGQIWWQESSKWRRTIKASKQHNNYFIEKIKTIRWGFTESDINPIDILKILKPSVTQNFVLPFLTIPETWHYIKDIKASNTIGHDSLNSKLLKTISAIVAPHITHLVNCCIRQSKFPDIYKMSRILLLLKKGKDKNLIDSYRPINNLCVIEKSNWIAYEISFVTVSWGQQCYWQHLLWLAERR